MDTGASANRSESEGGLSAVMVERPSTQWRGLEPEGRGHDLLTTWALYRRGGERDGLPRDVKGYLREPLDKAHDSEPPYVLAIDDILAGLYRTGYEHTVEIVKRYYLSGEAIYQLAPKVCRTEGFVRLSLRGVCALAEDRIAE
jgi:hypothetical protein